MKSLLKKLLALALCGQFLFGCAGPQVSQYANEKPTLDLSEYFNGTIDAYGIFTNRSGQVVKRFTVLMQASWKLEIGRAHV